jgi:ubiquinone/menaquinone biosynthesis C-methylase UbiE
MRTGFESIDSWYEKPLGRLYLKRTIQKLTELLDKEKVKGRYVLDAGCGAGHYTFHLSEIGCRAIGIDRSQILISKALGKSKRQNTNSKSGFITAEISSLPFASDFFEFIICLNVIEFILEPENALSELKRVLMPQGVLILGVCNKNSIWGLIRRIGEPFKKRDPFFSGHFFSKNELKDLILRVGLELERIDEAIYFPPISHLGLALLFEKIGKSYLKKFPGCLIMRLKKIQN